MSMLLAFSAITHK